jgi:Skp family chaperone for outer membrane proteins
MLQTVYAWIKKYWQLLLLIVATVFGVLFFRRQENGFSSDLKAIRDAHEDELKRIQSARDEEKRQHIENQKRLESALATVQEQYDLAKKDLDQKKKREIEEIVSQYGDNPTELAKQLSSVTGFSIILPVK